MATEAIRKTDLDIFTGAATMADIGTILNFIRASAVYEKLAHEMQADENTLSKYLFGSHRYAECLIAQADGRPAGFALFFHNFSTFLGKPGLYLEDLFVNPEIPRPRHWLSPLQRLGAFAGGWNGPFWTGTSRP
jgi:hypothetical protein